MASAPAIPAPPAEKPVRVGLGWGLSSAEITAPGGLLVIAGGQILTELPPGQVAAVKLTEGKVQVNALAPVDGAVRLVPKAPESPNYIGFKGRSFRGEIEVVAPPGGKLSVVNVINLEEYLQGVVPNEMYHTWPEEALKAQAVAARTYAQANLGKRKAEGYDLRDNTDDQAYGGVTTERASTTRAVQLTEGQVITYQGRLVSTFYHSSSGGHTENNENVWTGGYPVPYLRGVVDYDNLEGNRYFTWFYEFTPDEFSQRMKQAGYNVGSVSLVSPGAPGPSGRPTSWGVSGSGGAVTLTMQQMRSALGLPSSARSIQPQMSAPVEPPPPPPAPVHVVGASGTVSTRQVAGSYVIGADGKVSQLPGTTAVARGMVTATVGKTPPQPAPIPAKLLGFEVKGGGHGHAVGLSQWGAHGMAQQGKSYTQILTHYYSGTKVETR